MTLRSRGCWQNVGDGGVYNIRPPFSVHPDTLQAAGERCPRGHICCEEVFDSVLAGTAFHFNR